MLLTKSTSFFKVSSLNGEQNPNGKNGSFSICQIFIAGYPLNSFTDVFIKSKSSTSRAVSESKLCHQTGSKHSGHLGTFLPTAKITPPSRFCASSTCHFKYE